MRLQKYLNPIVVVPSARKRKNDAKGALLPELPKKLQNLSGVFVFQEAFTLFDMEMRVISRLQMTKSESIGL